MGVEMVERLKTMDWRGWNKWGVEGTAHLGERVLASCYVRNH